MNIVEKNKLVHFILMKPFNLGE